MESLELYKEFYFKEIDRKHVLNNLFNIPILIISVIVSTHLYIFNQDLNPFTIYIGKVSLIISILSITISIVFLMKAYSNLFKTHTYRETPGMNELYKYETKLIGANKKPKKVFIEFLKKEFSECADHNFKINKDRTEQIAKAKKTLFFGVIATLIFSFVYLVSLIII